MPSFSSRLIIGGTLAVTGMLVSQRAAAQVDEGFALQPYDASSASDRFFAVSDAESPGDTAFSARADALYAYKRLLSGMDPATGDTVDVVSSQFYVYAGATIALDDLYLFGFTLPVAVSQSGDASEQPGAGLGDLELTARFAVFDFGRAARLAPQLDLLLPTGNDDKCEPDDGQACSLTGDGTFGAHPRMHFSGEAAGFVYAANLGYLVRDRKELPGITVGSSGTFGFALAYQLLKKRLQLGLELQGRTLLSGGPFDGSTTPAFALAGAKFRIADLVVGLAGGPSLTEGVGSSPRVLLTFGYVPRPD